MNITREDVISAAEEAGLSVDISSINGNDSLSETGLDSLEIMTFLLSLEEKFNIKIPDQDVDSLDTIDGIIEYFARL